MMELIHKKRWVVGFCVISLLAVHSLLFAQSWQSLGEDAKPSESLKQVPQPRQNNYGLSDLDERPRQSGSETSDHSGDTDAQLARMAQKYERAIGLVVLVMPRHGGGFEPIPFGTAWALTRDTFATNAHITEDLIKMQRKGLDTFVVMNKNSQQRYRILRAISHPRYGEVKRNFDGVPSVDFTYDVGLIKVDGHLEITLPVASPSELQKLASGYRIAYLGFPTEGLINGNVDVRNPVATMQSGIITAVSDYWQGDGGFKNNLLIRHNLGATGGASGSPLFNVKGEVVALLNAGNIAIQVSGLTKDGRVAGVKRTPHAAMVNFGQRVDLINQIR